MNTRKEKVYFEGYRKNLIGSNKSIMSIKYLSEFEDERENEYFISILMFSFQKDSGLFAK